MLRYLCVRCKSEDVHVMAWVKVNGHAVVEGEIDEDPLTWCPDCGSMVGVMAAVEEAPDHPGDVGGPGLKLV